MIIELRDRQGMKWADIVRYLIDIGMKTRNEKKWTSVGVRRVHQRWTGKIW
jgi:hypothetical protein